MLLPQQCQEGPMTFRGQHLVDWGRSTILVAKKAHLSGILSDQGPSWSAPRGWKARGLLVSGTVFSGVSSALTVLLALRLCTEACFVPLPHGFCAGPKVRPKSSHSSSLCGFRCDLCPQGPSFCVPCARTYGAEQWVCLRPPRFHGSYIISSLSS